jgi:uncharacterized protein YndB with AHSA1/START domain
METGNPRFAKAAMLIRKPAADVFEAFIDPAITTRFWFTRSSGRLEPGASVRWDWEMYGHSTRVDVKAIERDRRILVEWSGQHGPTAVEWTFTARDDGTTFVAIAAELAGSGDVLLDQAIGTTEGFTLVLAGAKALLEHGIALELVADRFPDGSPGN